MKIINTIYSLSFDELNAEQKKKAIDLMREIGNQDTTPYWSTDLVEQTKEDLKEYGINDADIQWQGFCNQGDGASISTDNIDPEKFLRKVKAWSKFKNLRKFFTEDNISLSVYRFHGNYSHEYTVSGNVEFTWTAEYTKNQEYAATELQTLITETIRDLSRNLYKALENENDYHNSDAAIIENIAANDYHFNVDNTGKVLALS